MTATTAFLFCVCQAGAEAAVAEELAPLGLRRARMADSVAEAMS